MTSAGGDDAAICSAMIGVGAGFFLEGRLDEAEAQLEAATAYAARLHPHLLGALSRYWRGWTAKERGDLALSQRCLEEATEIGRILRHAPAIAHPLSILVQV